MTRALSGKNFVADASDTTGLQRLSVKGRVSVIMACHNAQAYVAEALESVFAQTYGDVELVVVDDGSTDDSPRILKQHASRAHVLTQPNQGPYPARNAGLACAHGEFVAFLDADDWWAPECLDKLHAALVANPDAALAYCGWQNVGLAGGRGNPHVPPDYEVEGKMRRFLRAAAPWPIHAALVRRRVLDAAGGFDTEFRTCMDYELWLRIGAMHKIVRVPEVLAFYRFHDSGQITSTQWRQARNTWLIKKKFIAAHPEAVSGIPAPELRELVDGGLIRRAYDLYWKRDVVSARMVFRLALKAGAWKIGDLKYLLPALLPESAYVGLVSSADRGRTRSVSARRRLYHHVVTTRLLPWRIRNGVREWTETRCRARMPALYRWLHFGTARERLEQVTAGPLHHFFGYYDKSPWNASGSLLLAHEVAFNDRPPTAEDAATLGIVHLGDGNRFEPLALARCWNWQQGAMPQWNPADPEREFFHNDRRNGRFVGILRRVDGNELREYDRPFYAISPDGKHGFSLNFARLQTHRPGYGYAGVDDPYASDLASEKDGIEAVDLTSGVAVQIVSLAELAARNPVESMAGAWHYLNHIQVSPGGNRIAFFHIWRVGSTWRVRLYVMDIKGSSLDCLLDTGTISHYDWLDDDRILVWAESPNRERRFLLCDVRDRSSRVIGEGILAEDGHCSFSPDRKWVLNDTYPDKYDMRTLMLYKWSEGPRIDLARLYSPVARWWGELRCDLHPRWRRDGKAVCVDSVHSGERQMYIVSVEDVVR